MLGNDMKMSAHLMITVSTAPLKYPANSPNGTPMAKLISAEHIWNVRFMWAALPAMTKTAACWKA